MNEISNNQRIQHDILSINSFKACQLFFNDYILPPCFVCIFWLFNIKSNCTVFPIFVRLNVGFLSLERVQCFSRWSGPKVLLLVLTTSATLISIGDCLLPSHVSSTPPQFAGPKPKHFDVFTLNISEYGLLCSVN